MTAQYRESSDVNSNYYVLGADSSYDIDGVSLMLKPTAEKLISGKIVVPKTWENLPVIAITGFNH
jgi:hypothetical protein